MLLCKQVKRSKYDKYKYLKCFPKTLIKKILSMSLIMNLILNTVIQADI